VRIGGRWGARPAVAAVRKRALGVARTPAFGVAVITPLVLAGAVGGAAPPVHGKSPIPSVHAVISPVAAVSPSVPDLSGPAVIAIEHAPTAFHVAAGAVSAPPPPMIVNAPGALGIPMIALSAYRNAERKMAVEAPGCGLSWNLLAGIGRIESGHAGGGAVDARGTAVVPIYGPALDGTLPGNEVILQSSVGNRVTYARAMGPMQFLPGTWARYASDGKGDGTADPQNLFDATLAAARYLCSGGLNLRDPAQVMAAILRYNNSMPYAQNVLGWAAAYATGVVPVDLPPITGPPPPLADARLEHLENAEGLGPGLPMNINGLPVDDPLARMPLIDLGPPQVLGQPPMFPWMATTPAPGQTRQPGCTLICIGPQSPPPGGPQFPSPAFPPGVGPPPPDAVGAGAPPAALPPAPPAGPPPSDPLAGPPAGPPAGSPPGPAAGSPKASPSPKPAGPPPNAATDSSAPNQPAPAPGG
jgi:membrane-bound lytic murein transglycosylase B